MSKKFAEYDFSFEDLDRMVESGALESRPGTVEGSTAYFAPDADGIRRMQGLVDAGGNIRFVPAFNIHIGEGNTRTAPFTCPMNRARQYLQEQPIVVDVLDPTFLSVEYARGSMQFAPITMNKSDLRTLAKAGKMRVPEYLLPAEEPKPVEEPKPARRRRRAAAPTGESAVEPTAEDLLS